MSLELHVGRVDASRELVEAEPIPMRLVGPNGDGSYAFEAVAARRRRSGLNGSTVRVLPARPDRITPFQPNLITWAPAEVAP